MISETHDDSSSGKNRKIFTWHKFWTVTFNVWFVLLWCWCCFWSALFINFNYIYNNINDFNNTSTAVSLSVHWGETRGDAENVQMKPLQKLYLMTENEEKSGGTEQLLCIVHIAILLCNEFSMHTAMCTNSTFYTTYIYTVNDGHNIIYNTICFISFRMVNF